MLVAAQFLWMGMIIKLRMRLGVVDVPRRIVIPLKKCLDVAQKLANDIAARIGEHAMTFNDFPPPPRPLSHEAGLWGSRRN